MPELTDEQIIAALRENDHEDVAEALGAKLDPDTDEDEGPTKPPGGLGGALRRAAGGG